MINIDRITLKQLRALASTMELGTIAAAANRLNVTAPAVSLQLKLLGEITGLDLYERTRDGLAPTPAGREAVVAAARVEATLLALGQALDFLAGGDRGHVSIGAVSTAKYFVPQIIAVFAKDNPSVDVRLRIGNREQTIEALEKNQLDFAIMGRPPEGAEFEKVVIGDHPHVFIAPVNHPFAERRNIEISDLTSERFLLREKGSGTRTLLRKLFSDAALDPETGVEFGGNETIKQSVIAGLGISFLSAQTIATELAEKRLVILDVKGAPVIRHWFIVKQVEKRFMPSASRLWKFVATDGDEFL